MASKPLRSQSTAASAMKGLREQSQSGPESAPLPNWSLCIALYDQDKDCKSEDNYLQFNKGQLIKLIHCEDEDWWWGMTEDGKEGGFASILVKVLPHPRSMSMSTRLSRMSSQYPGRR